MTYLFIFAHPDDETVCSAGTIKRLIDNGDEVIVVSATDGSAGEVHVRAQKKLAQLGGSVAELRRTELRAVSELLGIKKLEILDFKDGLITNIQVWGELKEAFIELIEKYKPDVVVTFDHTGWYFHLDHVGVSIAATLAFSESIHRPQALFHVFMQLLGAKWKYVFPKQLPVTHHVDVSAHRDLKLKALQLHDSQDISPVQKKVLEEKKHYEIFQLAFATKKGQQIFAKHPIFEKVSA